MPTVINAPGTWSEDRPVDGHVAALGLSLRTRPVGVFDDRTDIAPFAVSASDGSAYWIELPGLSLEQLGLIGGFALSPDGRWIGWTRPAGTGPDDHLRIAGWSVMDTATGKVRRLAVDGVRWVRSTTSELAFSGDSRYLLTSYEHPDSPDGPRSRSHQLVAWDVQDGTPAVVEKPGHHWLPNLGSGPAGVVWARGRQVFVADPKGGERTSRTLPRDVLTPSWSPDGTGFAYIGRPPGKSQEPDRLYVHDRPVRMPAGIHPGQILGWRDSSHVVVGHHRTSVAVVDTASGKVEVVDMAGHGDQMNSPLVAAALWQEPLREPVDPEGTTDPRRPWRWATAGISALGLAAWLGLRWRRRVG